MIYFPTSVPGGFPGGSDSKESVCNAGDMGSIIPELGRFPWRTAWQPTPVFLPGKSHGQRRLVGYSPWGHKSWTRLGTKPPPPLSPLEGFMRKEKPAQRQFLPHSFKRTDTQPMKQKSQSKDVLAAQKSSYPGREPKPLLMAQQPKI